MTMKTINEIEQIWKKASENDTGFLLVDPTHPIEFHIGFENGQKCIMAINTGKLDSLYSSKAINAKNIITGRNYSLMLTLNYDVFDEIFTKLCWDLIEFTRTSTQPIVDLVNRFSNWQELLQKIPDGLLSTTQQKGLIGELLYLEKLIEDIGEDDAVSSWVGPEGADQDYLTNDYWAEIKATTASSDSILISSLQQLDREDDGYIVVYFLDKTSSSGLSSFSLSDVFRRLINKLNSIKNRNSFICKLSKIGFYEKDLEKYEDTRFLLSNIKTFFVSESFPKLTKNNVSAEIVEAKYRLSLSSIDSYKV